VFGEGPRWREGRLWFSDVRGGKVIALDEQGNAETIADVPARPSGLGWLPDGRLIIVSTKDSRLLRREADGALVTHAELPTVPGTGNWNDMVVDARGNAYVGNTGYSGAPGVERTPGCLALVRPDGSVSIVVEQMKFPNGPAITPDGKTLIVAESFGRCLTAFDIDDDGTLRNRREFANVYPALPDGIALDAEGAVWYASPTEQAYLRVKEGGEVLEKLSVYGRMAIACALGGADRKTLFLCTVKLRNPEKLGSQEAARIETVRVAVAGAGIP
jgi:sugar lactone lactonase YvrE